MFPSSEQATLGVVPADLAKPNVHVADEVRRSALQSPTQLRSAAIVFAYSICRKWRLSWPYALMMAAHKLFNGREQHRSCCKCRLREWEMVRCAQGHSGLDDGPHERSDLRTSETCRFC